MHLDFVVAGFSKCGTTSLCAMLAAHPNLFMPNFAKEPRFFCEDDYAFYWNWYRNLFYTAPANTLLGEGSVSYTEAEFAERSITRLIKHFPQIKIILIARDPIDRIESSYRQMHDSGTDWGVHCPFNVEDALLSFPNMLNDTRYNAILQLYKQYVPKENILVLFQEDLKARPQAVLSKCFTFLKVNIQDVAVLDSKKMNDGGSKYYDTEKLRKLWDSQLEGKGTELIYSIPTKVQNQFLPQFGLRRAFEKSALDWSLEAQRKVVEVLGDDPKIFLEQHGKTLSFWLRYARFYKQFS